MSNKPVFDYPLFAMGFRTFFMLAGFSALALIALWNTMINGGLHVRYYYPGTLWHAHEMLLGYTIAVIAGFLLTAVKNWTGMRVVSQDQLAALGLLWLYGRITPLYAGRLPDSLIAALDFAFIPALVFFTGRAVLRSGKLQYLIYSALLLLMAVANALIHAQILGVMADGVSLGIDLLVAMVVVMIVVTAGRLFPAFIERSLSGVFCFRHPFLDMLSVASTLAVFLLFAANITGFGLALAAIVALIANSLRLAGWYDNRIWFVPLLWILFVGYGWVIMGFALLSLAAYSIVTVSLALHAFTVGGIGVLTLGMMARVALGHTGRVLKASNLMAVAFLLINLAAMLRVLFPAMLPIWHSGFIIASAYSWLAAFALFGLYYFPILSGPRQDGQAG